MAYPVYKHLKEGAQCDLCSTVIEDVLYDVRIPSTGRWGNLCYSCFTAQRASLGPGFGQRYLKQPDGRYLKTNG